MKHDKHKAKRSAKYKKQHGIPSGKNENKSGKSTDIQAKPKGKEKENGGSPNARAQVVESILIEKQHEMRKEYSRRKIESNWAKYDDFNVDDEREAEVYSEQRGEDFQKLVSKSDDASSQLRMKDEVWWDEDDQLDETETEIGKLFKVDFVDVAQRLEAIPLHVRLGISTKYIDDDLLNKINEDAAEHAKIYQDILDSDNAQDTDVPALSDSNNDKTSRGPLESMHSASMNSCERERLQEVADENRIGQKSDDASTTDCEREHCTRDMEQTRTQVTDNRKQSTAASDGSGSHPGTSSSSPGALVTSNNKTAVSADVNEPAAESQTKPDEEKNLEDWLDEVI